MFSCINRIKMATSLENLLSNCHAKSAAYTKITDLPEEIPYPIKKFERVTRQYGEAVMATLAGHEGEEASLRVYLPRRYEEAMSNEVMDGYNKGREPRLCLLKKKTPLGHSFPHLEL